MVDRKRSVLKIINEVNKLVTGESENVFGMAKDAFKLSDEQEVFNIPLLKKEKGTQHCIGCGAPITGIVGEIACCDYCDTEQKIKGED